MSDLRHAPIVLRLLVLVGVFCAVSRPEASPKALSVADGKALVYEALPSDTRRLPGLALEPGELESGGRCITFDVLWTNPAPGSAHVNFYTVDLWNAAVWSGPRPPVKLETGLRVLQEQRRLRRKLGLTGRTSQLEAERSPCWR